MLRSFRSFLLLSIRQTFTRIFWRNHHFGHLVMYEIMDYEKAKIKQKELCHGCDVDIGEDSLCSKTGFFLQRNSLTALFSRQDRHFSTALIRWVLHAMNHRKTVWSLQIHTRVAKLKQQIKHKWFQMWQQSSAPAARPCFFVVQNFIFWLNSVQSLLRLIEIRVVQVPVASLGHSNSTLWYILAVLAIENCNL